MLRPRNSTPGRLWWTRIYVGGRLDPTWTNRRTVSKFFEWKETLKPRVSLARQSRKIRLCVQTPDLDDYDATLRAARDMFSVVDAAAMSLQTERIETIADLACHVSVPEEPLRVYAGLTNHSDEQVVSCAYYEDVSVGSTSVVPQNDNAVLVQLLLPPKPLKMLSVTYSLAPKPHAVAVMTVANHSIKDIGWIIMEDVNYVPPPSIASRKPNPIHREKISENCQVSFPWHALVAKQVSRKEIAADADNVTALAKTWQKLIKRRVWGIDPVKGEEREYNHVRSDALRQNQHVHFGRTYGFVIIKQSELDKAHWTPNGRVAFVGNRAAHQSGLEWMSLTSGQTVETEFNRWFWGINAKCN